MAKEKMLCPFSKKLCRECPLYRGRHYYLCYCREYQGHLRHSENQVDQVLEKTSVNTSGEFKMPPVLKPSPTWLVLNEFAEREGKRGEK
jgi:hypothetical protein